MTKMNDSSNDPMLARFRDMHQTRFPVVLSMEFLQTHVSEELGYSLALVVTLSPLSGANSAVIKLSFEGVRNLSFTPGTAMPILLTRLTINRVSHWQWEGVGYEVKEIEDDTISFICRDFTAEMI